MEAFRQTLAKRAESIKQKESLMRMFLIIVFALAGFSLEANAQAQGRFEQFVQNCPYRAAQARKAIALGHETRQSIESEFRGYSQAEWNNMIASCRKDEASIPVPPRAPQSTVVEGPRGKLLEIVKRPPGAPIGEYYRCDPVTKMPDPASRKICGPVPPSASGEQAAPPPRTSDAPAAPRASGEQPAPPPPVRTPTHTGREWKA